MSAATAPMRRRWRSFTASSVGCNRSGRIDEIPRSRAAPGRRLGISPMFRSRLACDDQHMPKTVLIVDDHGRFRSFARRLLEAGGFTVVGEAADGASALAAAEVLRPQVVLLDVLLPDTDGFAVADRLAERGNAAAVVLT